MKACFNSTIDILAAGVPFLSNKTQNVIPQCQSCFELVMLRTFLQHFERVETGFSELSWTNETEKFLI